ncbi:MAG: hypothetical protein HZC22_13250 [Rhodocyclales bacterium]|nr:hypothetical protein [Rhodocyclales bacterium]
MTGAVVTIRMRALDALQPIIREIESHPERCLIIDSVSGASRAWPRHCAVPPGWYRMSLRVKTDCRAA